MICFQCRSELGATEDVFERGNKLICRKCWWANFGLRAGTISVILLVVATAVITVAELSIKNRHAIVEVTPEASPQPTTNIQKQTAPLRAISPVASKTAVNQRAIEQQKLMDFDDESVHRKRQIMIQETILENQGGPVAATAQALEEMTKIKVERDQLEIDGLKRIIAAGQGTPEDEKRISQLKTDQLDSVDEAAAALGYNGVLSHDVKQDQK